MSSRRTCWASLGRARSTGPGPHAPLLGDDIRGRALCTWLKGCRPVVPGRAGPLRPRSSRCVEKAATGGWGGSAATSGRHHEFDRDCC